MEKINIDEYITPDISYCVCYIKQRYELYYIFIGDKTLPNIPEDDNDYIHLANLLNSIDLQPTFSIDDIVKIIRGGGFIDIIKDMSDEEISAFLRYDIISGQRYQDDNEELKQIRIIYVPHLIENDDTILDVKKKIFAYITPENPIPIEHQYLFTENILDPNDAERYIDHYFVKVIEKQTRKRGIIAKVQPDIIKPYVLNPYKFIYTEDSDFYDIVQGKVGTGFTKRTCQDKIVYNIRSFESDMPNTFRLVSFSDILDVLNGISSGFVLEPITLHLYIVKYWPDLVKADGTLLLTRSDDRVSILAGVNRNEDVIKYIKYYDFQAEESALDKAHIKYHSAGISETIIHINYTSGNDEPVDDFIELYKIFDQFRLNPNVPFMKYKTETGKTMFKIYKKNIAMEQSKIDPITVKEWIGNSIRKSKIDEEFKTIGRGISIKILSYESRDRKKFNTLNIYRNGRMELKCSIDEHDIPLYGTKEHINKSIENVRNYVLDSIKNISYQYIGYKHMEILDPKNIGMQAREGNTRIAFLNVISYCDYMPQLNYTDFNDFAEYFNTYVSVIRKNKVYAHVEGPNQPNEMLVTRVEDALEMRYKRISEYIAMNVIDKFIYDFTNTYEKGGGDIASDVVRLLSTKFLLPKGTAEGIYEKFLNTYTQRKTTQKTRRGEKIVKLYDDVEFALSKMNKHPGIDIRIQKSVDRLKIFIKGVQPFVELTYITNFIKSFIELYVIDLSRSNAIRDAIGKPAVLENIEPEKEVYEQSKEITLGDQQTHIDKLKNIIKQNEKNIDEKYDKYIEIYNIYLEQLGQEDVQKLTRDEIKAQFKEIHKIITESGTDMADEAISTYQEINQIKTVNAEKQLELDNIEESIRKNAVEDETNSNYAISHGTQASTFKNLNTLKTADPLFLQTKLLYPKQCQANKRQPLVMSYNNYKDLLTTLRDEKAKLEEYLENLKGQNADADTVNRELKKLRLLEKDISTHQRGVNYNGNHYFCSSAYDMVNNRSVDYEDPTRVGTEIIRTLHNEEYPYANFLQSKGDDTICLPCCYKKPHPVRKECKVEADDESGSNPSMSGKSVKSNYGYILKHDKTKVSEGRLAYLPDSLYGIIDYKYKPKSSELDTTPSIVRCGVKHDKSPFLEVFAYLLFGGNMANLYGFLDANISINDFLAMKSGSLKIVFRESPDDTDAAIYDRFKTYLASNFKINEDLLWDTMSTIIGKHLGIKHNIVILESRIKQNENLNENIVFKCPIGFNMNESYDVKNPTIILFKYNQIYEFVCEAYIKNGIVRNAFFVAQDHEFIERIINYAKECESKVNRQYYEYEKMYLKKLFKESGKKGVPQEIKFEIHQPTADDLREHLLLLSETTDIEIVPILQLVDNYNKTYGFIVVVDDGTQHVMQKYMIPIKPSSIDTEREDEEVENSPLLIPVASDKEYLDFLNNQNQSFDDLYHFYANLLPADLKLKPLLKSINTEGEAIGFILENHLRVDFTRRIVPEESDRLPSMKQYYDTQYIINKSIASQSEIEQIENSYVNKHKFESETYNRMRLELSNWLVDYNDNGMLFKINQVINNKNTLNLKRSELFELIYYIFDPEDGIITDKRTLDTLYYTKSDQDDTKYRYESVEEVYYKYKVTNVRQISYNREPLSQEHRKMLDTDPHCVIAPDGTSKLFVPKYNLLYLGDTSADYDDATTPIEQKNYDLNINKYVLTIVEELLRNQIKRNEIMNDEVDDLINHDYYQKFDDVLLVDSEQYKGKNPMSKIDETIDNIYNRSDKIKERLNSMYDVINPSLDSSNMNEYSGCIGELISLPLTWIPYAGHKLQRVKNNESPNCIFYAITIALNQRSDAEEIVTVEKLRLAIADRVKLLSLEYKAFAEEYPAQHNPYSEEITGRKPWELWRDLQIHRVSNMVNIFYSIETIEDWKKYMMSLDYTLKSLDLIILSQVYDVNFIVLHSIKKDAPIGSKIMNTFIQTANPATATKYILLFEKAVDRYEIIVDSSRSPHRFIHDFNDIPWQLRDEINAVRGTQRPVYDRDFTIDDIMPFLQTEELDVPIVHRSVLPVWRVVSKEKTVKDLTDSEKISLKKRIERTSIQKKKPSVMRKELAELAEHDRLNLPHIQSDLGGGGGNRRPLVLQKSNKRYTAQQAN